MDRLISFREREKLGSCDLAPFLFYNPSMLYHRKTSPKVTIKSGTNKTFRSILSTKVIVLADVQKLLIY